MSKLFKLKEWLTVPDAAKNLSTLFGEDVTEAEVLRLTLDEKLKISVFLLDRVAAKRVEKIPIPMYIKHSCRRSSRCTGDWMLSVRDDEITYLVGVLNLPMIGAERLYVEKEYRQLINGKALDLADGDEAYVESGGQMYQLQESRAYHDPLSCDASYGLDAVARTIARERFCDMRSFPQDSMLVIRTDALREFEELVAGSTATDNPPETTSRREQQHEMILAIIAALNFAPLQIPDGGKSQIKFACLTRPRLFTSDSFDHAWKAGLSANLFRLANHEKFSPK